MREDFMEIKEEVKKIKEEKANLGGFATEILRDYKLVNKRLYIVICILITAIFLETTYLVYVLNDTQAVEDTIVDVKQDSEAGNNSYIGEDGEINNG